MANINQISPDGGTTVYDIEDPTARSGVNSLTPRVGIAEGKITTLQEQMLSVEDDLDALGTASTKNSTSVVTDSTDLVESGAVKDIVGWGNKNLYPPITPKSYKYAFWDLSSDVYMGQPVYYSDKSWNGLYNKVWLDVGTYVFSVYAKASEEITCAIYSISYPAETGDAVTSPDNEDNISVSTEWTRYEFVFSITTAGYVALRFENTLTGIPLYVSCWQLEKGSTATAYEPYHASVEDYCASKKDVKDIVGWGNKNLLDPDILSYYALTYVPVYVGNGDFTISTTAPLNSSDGANLFFLAGNVQTGASTAVNGVWNGQTRTVTAVNGYVTVVSRAEGGVNVKDYNTQLEKGSTATAYEPYHASVEDYCASKKDVKDIVGWGNKNLLNQSEIVLGSIDSRGEDTTSDRRLRTPFIKVVPLNTYALSCNNNSFWVFEIHEYSSSKTWLRYFAKNTNTAIYQASNDAQYIKVLYKKSDNSACYPYELTQPQIEKGSEVTEYEPYHASVDESKADNSVIGTVENGTNPTKSYAVNEFMVRDGAFCQVTAPVTTSSTWTEGSNYTKKSIAEVLQSLMS